MGYDRAQEPPHRQPVAQQQLPFDWLPYLLSFLRRRWAAMAVSIAVCVALALGYALTATPKFTAEVQLLIDIARTDQLRQQASARDALTLNSILESQVQLLQSAGLARKTVQRLGLAEHRGFVAPPSGLIESARTLLRHLSGGSSSDAEDKVSTAAQHLLTMLKVRRVGQTYVIGISVTSPGAEEAAWLANGIAETYLADEVQAKEEGIRQATGWLQARIKELHDQALVADRSVQQYKAEHNIVDTDHGLMGSQQLTELTSQLVTARATSATMLARLDRINAIMERGVDGGSVVDGLDNKVIVTLRQQYVDNQRRLAELTNKFGPEHLAVRDMRREMTEMQKSIHGELERIAETYNSDYEVARTNELSVQSRFDQMVAISAQTNVDMVVLRSLQSSADTYRALYQNFLQRYTQAVQDESFPVPEARVITSAVQPNRKSEPKTSIILAFAVVAGASTIAANLAQMLVQTAGPTVLLDWDFQNASLSLKLTGRRGPGCLNILADNAELVRSVHHHVATGLDFLPAGVADAKVLPRLITQSGQLHELMATLRGTYSYVVVDLPSLATVADAHFILHMLDAIVVVAEWGLPEDVPLSQSLARIGLDETKLLGVALNKATKSRKWYDTAPGRERVASLSEVY